MRSKYTNGNIFNEVAFHKFPRHKFNLGHFNNLTCNHGLAIPFFCDDVVPGDRIDINTFGRIQLQPLATSTMQNIKAYFRYFYVPYRLLWDEWDKFITQDSNDETAFDCPYYIARGDVPSGLRLLSTAGCLADYLGLGLFNSTDESGVLNQIPFEDDARLQFNVWRFQAYHLIWDYYFRDENLQEPETVELSRGLNSQLSYSYFFNLLPVAYEKDYFTTALPWPQKGDPVNLSAYVSSGSLLTRGSVMDSSDVIPYSMIGTDKRFPNLYMGRVILEDGTYQNVIQYDDTNPPTFYDGVNLRSLNFEDIPGATITGNSFIPSNTISTSLNINDLRYSNALQRFLERKALGGSRPSEFYLSMYGVRVDDLRIGQPLYLGGGMVNVSVTDIASTVEATSQDGTALPQGTLAGNGKAFPAVSVNHPYYCQEFGIVMGIMYIRPELNYTQGIPRQMTTFKPLDYYNPLFAHLGEEAVMKSELVVKPNINNTEEGNNDDIFGYQSRYAYLKHKRNEVHGDFKTTLSSWLLSASFPTNVELNAEFITVDQNYDIFAVTHPAVDHYLVELYNDYQKESSMPNHVIPSL